MKSKIEPEPITRPNCRGEKTVRYGIPGVRDMDGVKVCTLGTRVSVCNECLGAGTVHPLKAVEIERRMFEAAQNDLSYIS